MSLGFLAALAATPILVAGILIVGFRVPARTAMPVTYVLTAIIAVLVWDIPGSVVAAASIQGLFITFDILKTINVIYSQDAGGGSAGKQLHGNL